MCYNDRVIKVKGELYVERAAIKNFAYIINTVILALVFGLMYFFHLCDVSLLVYFSVPTAMIYIIGYYLIHKDRLTEYVTMVYMWLTLYMGVTTICLGYGYGFHMYCFSMIPITFVTEYMSHKLKTKGMNAKKASISIALFYGLCTGYVSYFGPLYERQKYISAFFWAFNAITVFAFLIYYSNFFIRSVVDSEQKLIDIAHIDSLTQLYNRYYMISCLEALPEEETGRVLAMADIDDFKKINDTYGHNVGDEVLKTVSSIMKQECADCEIARWGGEEFLILSPYDAGKGKDMFEHMRRTIEQSPIVAEDKEISITITVGIGCRKPGQDIDSWIGAIDEKLYFGKNNGKNRVVE